MRKTWARGEQRQRDARLSALDRELLTLIERRTVLGYGDGRIGVKAIAEGMHVTTRTVRRHLAALEALGYLEVRERAHGHGGPAVNCYRVVSPRGERDRAAIARRAARRAERDRARKEPRRARHARHRAGSAGGVLTRGAPALTRGRVNALPGTGECSERPPVPGGQADQLGVVSMPLSWRTMEADGQPGRGSVGVGTVPIYRAPPRRPAAPLVPVRVRADPVADPEAIQAARERIAQLTARGSAAAGWRRR